MKLPSIKKILREDVKDAPPWISAIIDPINTFMEAVYQSLNKNITFTENIASNVKELVVRTSSSYPTMDQIEFESGLRTRATGIMVMQAYEKSTYIPAVGPVYASWIESNGTIIVYGIRGLDVSKVYIVRLLVI